VIRSSNGAQRAVLPGLAALIVAFSLVGASAGGTFRLAPPPTAMDASSPDVSDPPACPCSRNTDRSDENAPTQTWNVLAIVDLSAELQQTLRYPRIAGRHELTKNAKRRKILECLSSRPGIHFRELGRATGMPDGGLQHHLRVLRYHGAITVVRHHNKTLIYPADTRTPAKVLPAEDRTLILHEIARCPGVRHRELMNLVRLKRTTLDYHVHALEASNEILIERIGRERIYHAASVRENIGISEKSESLAGHDTIRPTITVTLTERSSAKAEEPGSPQALPPPTARTTQPRPRDPLGDHEPGGNACNPLSKDQPR
jgi:predicted transcriptional regulator